jgi:hypothetical protein
VVPRVPAVLFNTLRYMVSANKRTKVASLVDRGANGGLAGADCRVLEKSSRTVDVSGIDNHMINDLPIVTAAGLVTSTKGPLIVIMHQYAYSGQGKTIHSSGQLEHYQTKVDDRSIKVGGKQRLLTLDGYIIPLSIRSGLADLDMTSPTDAELESYPHAILTSDEDWDPSVLDSEADPIQWSEDVVTPDNPDGTGAYIEPRFDDYGLTKARVIDHLNVLAGTTDPELYTLLNVYQNENGELYPRSSADDVTKIMTLRLSPLCSGALCRGGCHR